jgi:hypothetical protein
MMIGPTVPGVKASFGFARLAIFACTLKWALYSVNYEHCCEHCCCAAATKLAPPFSSGLPHTGAAA